MSIERLTVLDGIVHTETYKRIEPERWPPTQIHFLDIEEAAAFEIMEKKVEDETLYEVIIKFLEEQNDGSKE